MSGAPVVRGPRDLPDLRSWMTDQWRPGEPFAQTAHFAIGALAQGAVRPADAGQQIAEWCGRSLAEAQLWWVGAEMVDLIEASAGTLPHVALQDDHCPVRSALVVFERPLQGTDANLVDHTVLVDAIVWSPTVVPGPNFQGGPRPAISFMMYRRVDVSAGESVALFPTGGWEMYNHDEGPVTPPVRVTGNDAWLPLGRTDWAIGDDWGERHASTMPDSVLASMTEDRKWCATLWMLATQPNLVELGEEWPGRAAARRAARAGYSDPTVRVVNLRRSIYAEAGASRENTGGRTYRVRWPVEGHWRNQAYGPQRAYRRPTWIAPYIKGPEGAPMRKGATVHVLTDTPRSKR